MRQAPHADASNQACVDEGRQRHEQGHPGKSGGKPHAQIVDADIDLLGRVDEAEQGAEDEGAGDRVAECDAVREHDAEALVDRLDGERPDVLGRQCFRQADIHPQTDDQGRHRHEDENPVPVAHEHDHLAGARCDHRDDHEDHHDQRHDLGHLSPAIDVTDDRDGDDAGRGRADALDEAQGEKGAEGRDEDHGE